jgi:hypothetical protein
MFFIIKYLFYDVYFIKNNEKKLIIFIMEKIKKIHIKNNISFIDYQKNSQYKFILKFLHENNNLKYFHKIKLKKIKTPSSNSTLNSTKNENFSLLNNENNYQKYLNKNNNLFLKFNANKNNLAQSFDKKINYSSLNFDYNNNKNNNNENNNNNKNSNKFLNKILLNNNNNFKLNYNNKILLPKINLRNCNNNKEKNPFKNSAIRIAFNKQII